MKTFALTVLAVISVGSVSFAQTNKISTVWKCAAPNPANALPVGDAPDHAYVVEQTKCTTTSGEVGGVKQKEGMATEFADAMGANSKGHGVFVETLANGDKIFYNYEFTGTSKDNKFDTGANKFTIASGTGQFKSIKGSGSCRAKGSPDGTAEFTCTGTYTMAK